MDPFEVRMQFLSILRRLNASQQSIQKVVAYALKYFPRCGEDLWDCIFEECQKGSLNTRINILYLLDSLSEASLLSKVASSSTSNFYVDFVARDLATIVDYVVPQGREGLINLTSAVQILENWRTKRVIDPQKVEDVLNKLDAQKSLMHDAATASASGQAVHAEGSEGGGRGGASESLTFSRNEVFKRIEEDRERHKRLRERRWVQPVSHALGQGQGQGAFVLASFAPMPPAAATSSASAPVSAGPDTKAPTATATTTTTATTTATVGTSTSAAPVQAQTRTQAQAPLPLDIEFDNEWETTSDWNEDDDEAVLEENALCFPNAATRLGPAPAPAPTPTPTPSHLTDPFDPSSSSASASAVAAHQRGGAQTEDPGAQIPKVRVKIDRERARMYAR